MSNVIPFVSSSPPPMDDDDAAFKWDDDDDEYGNFASASSVSATTLASDSSMTANWSTSETSVSAEDALSNKSAIKSDSKASHDERGFNISNSNCNRSENISSSDPNLQIILPQVQSQSNDCDENNDDFQNFANFGSAEFSNSPMKQVPNEKTDSNPSPQDISIPPTPNGTSDNANAFEEDEFEEFAQFNDADITENWEHSSVNKPELDNVLRDENKTNSSNVSKDQCFQDAQSLIHGSEAVVTDIESVGSVHTKNNESIYSYASTIDSGMFSADMSPSCHPGDLSQTCLYSEKEESIPDNYAVTDTSGILTSSCSSSGQSHESIHLQDGSAENCSKNVTSFHNIIIDNKNSCEEFIVSDSSSCEGDGGNNISSQNQESGFICSYMPGSCDIVNDEGHSGRLSNSEENTVEGGLCKASNEVSTTALRFEATNHSSSSTENRHEDEYLEREADFLASPCVIEETVDIYSGPHDLGSSKNHDCNVETLGENVSLAQVNKVQECELKTADSDTDNGNIVEHSERSIQHRDDESGHGSSVECGDKCDKHSDLVCEGDNSTKDVVNYITSEDISEAGDFGEHVGNRQFSVHVISSAPGSGLPESTEALKDVQNCTEDEEEFGEFGITVGQTDDADDDDSNEVAPITFRTSVCELAADEGENDDDFTFDRERPPVFEDEGDNSSHEARGRGSKDISDGEDIDDFGEFDSAQNLHPSSSSASISKSDDGFGDFGKQQAAGDDDAGWADFGSAVTPVVPESISSSTVKQVSVPARPEQSKAQKLRYAVVSCFPDSLLQASLDQPQVDNVQSDGHEEQSHNGDNGTKNDDEGPLPLDTVVDLGLSNALEAKRQTWTVVQHPAKKDPKVRLWAHLKDVDSCHALMYGWHTSHCSKEVFATLHIDTQNILFTHKKQAVPFFASGLGILEPIRGGGAAQDRKKEKSSIPATKTTLLESSRQDNHLSPVMQDIPPVDFDWSSSGLTNPLTVFKTDNQNLTPSALQPLEEILKKTTPTVKLSTNEVWSPEAVRVLEKMPDLSFMQSRVLMFPVKQ